jgi:hypothetical protein
MKQILTFLALSFFLTTEGVQAQQKVVFAGGAFVASNKTTTFVGFVGPKLAATFPVRNFKVEVGLNGIPGLLLKPEVKLGLTMGSTVTLKKESWWVKPIMGVIFVKTTRWQPMVGIGFVF